MVKEIPDKPLVDQNKLDTSVDLNILSREELVTLVFTLRKRVAELEQQGRSEEEVDKRKDLADNSFPELPADLANAILIQMGAFWDDYDKVVAEVQAGAIFVLTLGDVPRARIEALQEHVATPVKRRELFRQRGEWMKRLDEGETIAPTDSGLVLRPLPSNEARAVMAHWPDLNLLKAPIKPPKQRTPEELKRLQELRDERTQHESTNLTEWRPRDERRTPEQRRIEREKMRRYHDSKRTPKELKCLQELREERAKRKS